MLGETVRELSGSVWARSRGHVSGSLPAVDLDAVSATVALLREFSFQSIHMIR
jgi:phosphoribosylformylglycinamidine (FGAM) synthase-like enzyme